MEGDKFEKHLSLIGISGRIWAIDEAYAFSAFADMLSEIELSSLGEKFELSSRRKVSFEVISNSSSPVDISYNFDNKGIDINNQLLPGSIAKITLSGVMRLQDGMSNAGTLSLTKALDFAKYNPNIEGLLLEIASGGGEVAAGNQLYNAVKSFGKPVVAAAHYAGSAAYMVASAAKEIVGIGTMSEVGSIGAFYSINKKVLEYLKENFIDIYSNKSGQKNKEFKALIAGDHTPIKDSLDQIVTEFHKIVTTNRSLTNDALTADTLEGGMFNAKDAKKRGLIDQIGTMDTAIKLLKSHINLNKK